MGVEPVPAGESAPSIYLTHDGLDWVRYDPSMRLMVTPRYGFGKAAATELATLKERVPEDLFDLEPRGTQVASEMPIVETMLHEATPNPFNPRTEIRFDLMRQGHVRLQLYNVRGQRVRTLESSFLPRGRYSRIWEGDDDRQRPVASGVYFVVMEADGVERRQKLTLVR